MNERLYPPLALPAILFLFLLVVILTFLFPFITVAAFKAAGLPGWAGLLILWLSLIGSFVNIPIKEIKTGRIVQEWGVIYFYGIPYYVPKLSEEKLIIAINVGGALIPLFVSLYMFLRILIYTGPIFAAKTIIAVLVVSLVAYKASRIIEGVGIALPAFIPALAAVVASLLLTWNDPASTAYISGSLGTLIGADLMNLGKLKSIRAGVVSIGGAGTFDGIFLTGLIALILVVSLR